MNITVQRLTPALTDDFLRFFDLSAFSDNPGWAGCYCSFYHFTDADWEKRSAADNRLFAHSAIEHGAMNGYLAYVGNEPVGWVNAGRRDAYARLCTAPGLPEGNNVCSVVCFTVAPECRGLGIASLLLSAVLDGAKGRFDYVEAYPLKKALSAALCYHGPLVMYENAGFETVKEMDGYWVLRKRV